MLVHSLWDQEDIYGDIAVYKAIEPKDTGNDKVFLVMGPWHHGQEIRDGSTLGALKFDSDTALYFRREILRPFLDHYLKDGAPKADVAPVTAFETGTNAWRRLVGVAGRLFDGLPYRADAAAPRRRSQGHAGRGSACWGRVRRIRVRSRQAGAVHPAPGARERHDVGAVAGQRSARGVRPARRSGLRVGCADRAGQDQRPADRQPDGLDERHRCRLGGEGHRRLPGSGRRAAGDGRLPADGVGRHLPRPRTGRASRPRRRSRADTPCSTSGRCRRRTTSSCRGIG